MSIRYICANCGTEIETGQFMAVIGEAPASGISTPIGRADKLFSDVGQTYCAGCLQSIGAEKLVAKFHQSRLHPAEE
jgi:hypothetical protein